MVHALVMDGTPTTVQGIGVSPGIAIGKAYLVDHGSTPIAFHRLSGAAAEAEEAARFEAAVAKAERDLQAIKESIHPDLKEHLHILDAHQAILRDRLIYDETLRIIREEKLNAQWALKRSLRKVHELFASLEDEYIRSRVSDVDSVGERILRNLAGQEDLAIQSIRERVIIVAKDLSPADAAQLQLERTLGLVTEMGGRTSHTSILARALGIPAVVGAEKASRIIHTGDILIIDGASGKVIINPAEDQIGFYYELQEAIENYLKEINRKAHLPALTTDRYRVRVEANIELLEEVVAAKDNGAESIGLYRTEFFFMNRDTAPEEEELYQEYRELAELMAPQTVTMRTLDLGAEKLGPWFAHPEQVNPALGLRAIRLCLQHQELFRTQLRAILRASAVARNIQLMFPLISGVGELYEAKRVLNEVRGDLERRRIPFDPDLRVGIMMEVPSAVAVADLLAREVDFFSIGTNDLIQYSLAIDRVNEHVAYLFEPLHPGILRMIKQVVDTGHRAGIPVTVCGEMAGEPIYVPIFLGFELDSLSMNPQSVPRVKNLIRRSVLAHCRVFLTEVLNMRTAEQIRMSLQEMVLRTFPEEFKFFDPSALSPKLRTAIA